VPLEGAESDPDATGDRDRLGDTDLDDIPPDDT
jgi:hypothetical protein